MVLLLIIMGALFSLLFGINSILRAARGREKVSFFETLIAFLALVFPVLALVANNNAVQPLRLVNMAAIGMGVLVIVISVLTFLVERGKPARPMAQRRSVLAVGIGLLLVAATFVVPVAAKLPSAAKNRNAAASAPANASNVNVVEVASPTAKPVEVTPTQTPDVALFQLSATPTRLASPMPTATNTLFVIATTTQGTITEAGQATGTMQAAAVQITGCTVVPRQNVNLRSGPATTFDLLLTIPFSTTLSASAKTKAGDWWYVTYENQNGWVSADYVNADNICKSLPTKAD